jgi:hypothetical protein
LFPWDRKIFFGEQHLHWMSQDAYTAFVRQPRGRCLPLCRG